MQISLLLPQEYIFNAHNSLCNCVYNFFILRISRSKFFKVNVVVSEFKFI
jgi:hypothetical protein